MFLFSVYTERIHSNHTVAHTLAMNFSEQVISVPMEDIRMEENGNCNMYITKKSTREDFIIGFSSLQYAFIVSDVNSVLRSSMVCYWKKSLMMVLPNKFYFCKKSMQKWEKMLENSFNFSTISLYSWFMLRFVPYSAWYKYQSLM